MKELLYIGSDKAGNNMHADTIWRIMEVLPLYEQRKDTLNRLTKEELISLICYKLEKDDVPR